MREIVECKKCELYKNQRPLLDNKKHADIMWVGLSAKKIISDKDIPLDENTNSGQVLKVIENKFPNIVFYKTNIVKCLPLDEKEILRYPNQKELKTCVENLNLEISYIKPKLIFLLGAHVIDTVSDYYKIRFEDIENFDYKTYNYKTFIFVPIHHPSYVSKYKQKMLGKYSNQIDDIIYQSKILFLENCF